MSGSGPKAGRSKEGSSSGIVQRNMSPLTLAECPVVTSDKIRYADTDRQGHVNNAVFATFCETGRVEILYDPDHPLMSEGAEFVIASLNLAFKGEIRWPGEIAIGTDIRKIGVSSIHIGQVLYQEERCVAEAETVVVQISQTTRTPLSLSQDARARLAARAPVRREL